MALSGAALYVYARPHLSETAALVAMAAYVVLPYHLIDLYHRGALAEWLGFAWMPLALLFTERLVEEDGNLLDAAGLALSYGGFLWSHLPTAHQFTMVLAFTAGWLALRRGRLRGLATVVGALVVGLGLAAAYVYPAIVEQAFIRPELVRDVWPYAESYLLVSTPPAQAPAEFWALLNQTWLFDALGTALAGIAFLLHARSEEARLRERALLWAVLGAFLCFMMTRLSQRRPVAAACALAAGCSRCWPARSSWEVLCSAPSVSRLPVSGRWRSIRARTARRRRTPGSCRRRPWRT
jgi:uncharacterized membrane protein